MMINITLETVSRGFKNAKAAALSVYQHLNHYKLLHRRTVHNKLLFKMGISEMINCLFCKTDLETIEHAYIECENVRSMENNRKLSMIPWLALDCK